MLMRAVLLGVLALGMTGCGWGARSAWADNFDPFGEDPRESGVRYVLEPEDVRVERGPRFVDLSEAWWTLSANGIIYARELPQIEGYKPIGTATFDWPYATSGTDGGEVGLLERFCATIGCDLFVFQQWYEGTNHTMFGGYLYSTDMYRNFGVFYRSHDLPTEQSSAECSPGLASCVRT